MSTAAHSTRVPQARYFSNREPKARASAASGNFRRLSVTIVCAASLFIVVPARGQSLLPPAQLSGLRIRPGRVPVGTWVRYSLYDARRGDVVLVRLAALERKGAAQRFEVTFTVGRGRTFVLQSLLEGSLDHPKRVLETIIQPPGQLPLRLPTAWAKTPLPALARDKPGTALGKLSLQVPAGTFLVQHFRRKQRGQVEDVWLSGTVPFSPVVRYRSGKVRLELLAYGQGATSTLQGDPVKLDPRLLQRLGPPPKR